MPDATYCGYVNDASWVGKMIDLIPYMSAGDRLTLPELAIAEGQPVEVSVTSGPNKEPLANISVHFRRNHDFQWQENGETKNGSGGPQWWATTDETGVAETKTLPGEMTASIYTPRWQAEKSITVVPDQPARIVLHREIGEKRTVTGRIVLDESSDGSLADVDIHVGSVDGNYEDRQSPKCDSDGLFAFDTFASEIGIFAYTKDGKAAGSIVTTALASPIELRLQPTGEYQGQLFVVGDQPAVSHPVRAFFRLEGTKDEGSRFAETFDVKRIETKTDAQGNFTLTGIPRQMIAMVLADAADGSNEDVYIGRIFLESDETRPRTISHLVRNEAAERKVPLAERYQTTLRDCALAGYRPIVIVADDSDGVISFVNRNYANYDSNKDVYPFMPIVVSAGKVPLEPADAAFLQERNWPLPQAGRIVAYGLDTDGKELGRQVVDVADGSAANQIAEFIHQHAPAPGDAEEKWTAAFAEAKRTNRRVWARVSQRYCGPCFRLSRWLDDQRALLEKDYVMLKIDDVRDKNGNDVAQRLYRGQGRGVPFHAIFDASGMMLIDSVGPLGNIGHPSGPEGKQQLRKMLLNTRQDLADVDVDQLVESTGD